MKDENIIRHKDDKRMHGQEVLFLVGRSNKIDNDGKRIQIYATGTIEDMWMNIASGETMIKIHFPDYRKFRKFRLKASMEININKVKLKSGYRFR